MGRHKILKTLLALVALVAFQGDQVSHAIDAYKPAGTHIHAAPAGPPSFAKTSLVRAHFEAHGHPCEDLGHTKLIARWQILSMILTSPTFPICPR